MTPEDDRGSRPVKPARKPAMRGGEEVRRGPAMRRGPAPRASAFEGERIAKVMARVGLCSRRDAEEWVRAGRVTINGALVRDPAVNVTDQDLVTVDDNPLAPREKTRLFLFHKPRGLVTTDHDPEGRPTVFDYVSHNHPALPRVVSVGRLDLTTEGLLLLTNDGGLARVLELPAIGWLRRYRVRAHGTTTPDTLAALREGITIEGVEYQPIEATLDRVQGANTWLTMALREGKNREVRRVLEHLGLEVNRLIRVSYGPFQLGEAPEGAAEEVRTRVLMDQLGPTLIAQAGADFSSLRRDEERDYQRERDLAEQPPPIRDKPVAGKRKHVSTMRAERDERAETGARVRRERSATEDRRGRTVAVEHVKPARPKPEDADTRNGRRFRTERQADRTNDSAPGRSRRDERPGPGGRRDGPPPRSRTETGRAPRARSPDDRPRRFEGDRPPPRGTAKFGERDGGKFAGKFGSKPGGSFGDKPGGNLSAKPGGKFGGKPGGKFGGKPGGKPGSSFGRKPSGSFGGKPGGKRPPGTRPR